VRSGIVMVLNRVFAYMLKGTKWNVFVPAVFLAVFLASYQISEARSGCCSHHGGVCGCGCCDGSGLSATCAPYYPECNSSPEPAPVAPKVVVPAKPIASPGVASSPAPTAKTTPSEAKNVVNGIANTAAASQAGDDSSFGGGIALGAIGAGALAWIISANKKK